MRSAACRSTRAHRTSCSRWRRCSALSRPPCAALSQNDTRRSSTTASDASYGSARGIPWPHSARGEEGSHPCWVSKMMKFVLKTRNFVLQMMDFAENFLQLLTSLTADRGALSGAKVMHFALKTRNFALKTRNFLFKTRNFLFKMMNVCRADE